MEKLINDYLATRLGIEPSENDYKQLNATVGYLKDNGKTNKEIFKILPGEQAFPKVMNHIKSITGT